MTASAAPRRPPSPATDEQMAGVRKRLKRARTVRGYSQPQWADLLTDMGFPVNHGTISRYESGVHAIPADYVLMVSRMARVGLDWLFTGEGRAPRATPADDAPP